MQKSKITVKLSLKDTVFVFKKHQGFAIVILVLLFVVGMSVGTFMTINPTNDKETIKKGEEKLQNLNIFFDKKTLEDIKKEQGPTTIQGSAGRNPFAPY